MSRTTTNPRSAQPLGQPTRLHRETPSQTCGPYVHIGCAPNAAWNDDPDATTFLERFGSDLGSGATCDRADTDLAVTILDGAGEPVTDAMIELWQHDLGVGDQAGFARRMADETGTGRFRIADMSGNGFVSVWIAARGINLGLHTRVYFASCDLPRLSEAQRRTLVAGRGEGDYAHTIRLQDTPDGGLETVFLDV